MKTWGSIEEAAKDLGITTRSVYRQIESGRIKKQRGKGGGWIYTKDEGEGWADDDVNMAPTVDGKDNGNDFIDSKDVIKRKPPKEATGDIIAPTTFPPDAEMISERKRTFVAEQRERQERAKRSVMEMKGSDVHPLVAEKEAEVKVVELDVRGLKAKREVRELAKEDTEERRKQERREMIERIKLNIIPPPLRNELPPSVLLETLNQITLSLAQLDTSMLSEEEVEAYATVVRDRLWSDPQINGTIRFAQTRAVFKCLDATMHEQHRMWRESKIQAVVDILEEEGIDEGTVRSILDRNGVFSYNDFLNQYFMEMLRHDPDGFTTMFKNAIELLCLTGNKEIADRQIGAMEQLYFDCVQRHGQGGNLPS